MPAVNILLLLVTVFKLACILLILQSNRHPFLLFWRWCLWLKFMVFPRPQVQSASLCVITDLLRKLTLPLSGALSWASYEVGIWKIGHVGHCGQSILRSLWSGFLVESLTCSVGSTSLLLCTSHSPPPRGAVHTSEFWMGRERNGLWQCVPQLGSHGLPHLLSFDPVEKSLVEKGSLGTELCCLGGMCEVGEIRLFFLPFPVHLISHFFCSSGGLELLHGTPGLSQRFSHLWVIV